MIRRLIELIDARVAYENLPVMNVRTAIDLIVSTWKNLENSCIRNYFSKCGSSDSSEIEIIEEIKLLEDGVKKFIDKNVLNKDFNFDQYEILR